MESKYDKMEEYIYSVYNVFQMVNKKADKQNDKKFNLIALLIYNYVKYMAKIYNVDLHKSKYEEHINLIYIFEYVTINNIELFDFSTIKIEDVNISNNNDLERFVLTHIYYITQCKNN